ncbi:MAG TPA: hypothetical protein DGD08_12470 [Gemmatimonas aurantiaca]|uniref:Outer membrane protein beta-barrel domain-containing protein n=3 Tax=Gemmatimonas aurantiaca TaxID=173480 RepID=C1ABV5_GEMAT|nr:hypothetical protein GAU_2940 [Gemmatimonas aurantiaca T-27]HCT58010.1 hypothetical protein [Gemmatimonas aurantiaca]
MAFVHHANGHAGTHAHDQHHADIRVARSATPASDRRQALPTHADDHRPNAPSSHVTGVPTNTQDHMPTSRSIRLSRNLLGLALLSAAAISSSTPVGAQQIGVSVLPSAQRIQWSDDFPLDDEYLYGGRVALRFGKWVELQPFYFQRAGIGMDSTRAHSAFGPLSAGRKVDLKHYGTNVQLNFGSSTFVPFARAGAGVLRLEPDSGDRQDRIALSAGGGVRFGIGGLNAELYAEQMGFRMNPRSLFGADTTTGASLTTMRNLVYGAAVTIPLSTMREDVSSEGLSGSTAPLEPFVGRLKYAGEHNLPNLEVAGVRAGIDFSSVFGVRGFYWRGVNDDRDGPAPVAGYGGEAQFNLSTGAGLTPYLIVGAGQIDYKDNFVDSLGFSRSDKTAFILGGGASFRLTDRVRINGSIRDYVMTVDDNFDNVAGTGDLTHNTMITAGLTISLGGRSTPSAREREAELRAERARTERMRESRDFELRERELRDRELMRSMEDRDPRSGRMMADSTRVYRDSTVINRTRMVRSQTPNGQWITIPVPEQGEIILRYGVPPRASTDSAPKPRVDTVMVPRDTAATRRIDTTVVIRDTSVVRTGTPLPTDLAAELREIERRLSARIDAVQQRPNTAPNITTINPVAPLAPGARDTVVVDRNSRPVFQRLSQTRTSDLSPYVGLGMDDGDVQFVVGLRADLGPVNANSGWHFVPELAVGMGEGSTSVLALANARYAFGALGGSSAMRPYLTLGAGVFSPTVLGVNTAVGSSFALRSGDKPLFLNVELQGINLFNQTRILVGLSRGR